MSEEEVTTPPQPQPQPSSPPPSNHLESTPPQPQSPPDPSSSSYSPSSVLKSAFEFYTDKAEIQQSESFYLIDSTWFNSWLAYTHFTIPQGYCFPFNSSQEHPEKENENDDENEKEKETPSPPGLIDNTSIIEAVIKNTLHLLNPGDDGAKDSRAFNILKPDLAPGKDYAIVPSAVWKVLSKEFGVVGGTNGGIERRYSRATGAIDAYPLVLHVKVFGNPLVSVNIAAASKGIPISRVKEGITRFLVPNSDVAAAQMRLWVAGDEGCERLIKNETLCVEHLLTAVPEGTPIEGNHDGNGAASISTTTTTTTTTSSSSGTGTRGVVEPIVLVLEQRNPGGKWLKQRQAKTSFSFFSGISSFFGFGESEGSGGGGYEKGEFRTMDVRAVPGVCGLRNLGCTCFMNSALQCLSNTAPLSEYFVSGRFRADVRAHNPLGTQGKLTEDFGALLRAMWSGGYDSVSPAPFKDTLGKWVPQFKGYDQQDSQELLATLLDKIHEDLNAGKRQKGSEEESNKKKDGSEEDEEKEEKDDIKAGERAWKAYTDRNKSEIVDLFYGQLRSSLTCPECGTVSTTFEPFLSLSVPLVDDKSTSVKCVYVSYEENGADKLNQSAVFYEVRLPGKDPKAGDLKAKMADIVGVENASDLMIGLMVNVGIRVINKYVKDNEKVSALGGTIFCYKVPGVNEIEREDDVEEEEKIEVDGNEKNEIKENNDNEEKKNENEEKIEVEKNENEEGKEEKIEIDENEKNEIKENNDNEEKKNENEENTCEKKKKIHSVITHYTCKFGFGTFGIPVIRKYTGEKIPGSVFYKDVWDALGSKFDQGRKNFEKAQLESQRETIKEEEDKKETNETNESNENNECKEPSDKKLKQDDTTNENNEANENNAENNTENEHKHTGEYPFVLTYQSEEGKIEAIPLDSDVEMHSDTFCICVDWCIECIKHTDQTPFSSVTIPRAVSDAISKEQRGRTLDECVGLFLSREQLDPGESWVCPHCKERRQAFKKMDIWRLPKVLVVHLKRFHSCSRWAQEKISTEVKFDVGLWDVSRHLCAQKKGTTPARYRLFAVSNHYGTLNGGHYTAFAKNRLDGNWYLFNDNRCTKVGEEDIKTNSAYMLFYERIDL